VDYLIVIRRAARKPQLGNVLMFVATQVKPNLTLALSVTINLN
jgi:hypothetical protein